MDNSLMSSNIIPPGWFTLIRDSTSLPKLIGCCATYNTISTLYIRSLFSPDFAIFRFPCRPDDGICRFILSRRFICIFHKVWVLHSFACICLQPKIMQCGITGNQAGSLVFFSEYGVYIIASRELHRKQGYHRWRGKEWFSYVYF